MAITAHFLKAIMAEARPIIERQMDDAKLISGFQKVVSANGGDWGALKALIKAHVEDEADDTGDGKRVKKIVDKADDTAAYADMLGLANMNENNFSASQSYAAATGREITEHEQPETPADETHERPSTNDKAYLEAVPQDEASLAGTGSRMLADREGRSEGEAASVDLPTHSNPQPSTLSGADKPEAVTPSPPAVSGTLSDEDVPAFILKDHKPLRPNCLNPGNCAGYGTHQCHACTRAAAESEAA